MPLTEDNKSKNLPADVYVSLVDALYREPLTLFIGALAAAGGVLLTAWTSGSFLLYGTAAVVVLAALLRLHDMRSFAKYRDNLTAEKAWHWELRYIIGVAGVLLPLGAWCIIGFAYLKDPFVQTICYGATVAYMIGIAGRNFAIERIVTAQIVFSAVPMAIAFFAMGTIEYFLAGLLMAGFFVTLKMISDRLRSNYLDAIISTRNVTELATRFDTALNNMPHGLAMFNATGRLEVANRRLIDLFKLPLTIADGKTNVRGLVAAGRRSGAILSSDVKQLAEELELRTAREKSGVMATDLADGRSLEITIQPMSNGGSVALIEDVTERKAAEAKIAHLARFDALTGLPNRAYFRERMDRVIALTQRGESCAVLFVDLDQFKNVNDTLGHPIGDALLRVVAERLGSIVRDTDLVSRFGGDEFVILQSPIKGPEQAASLARRILSALGEVFGIADHQIVVGASVGIAMAPTDGRDADTLLKNADMALYRAKSDGRAGWRFFEPDMDVKAQARRALELDLRTAVTTDAFEVYYQPLLNAQTMEITTCEALIRWPHAKRGMVSPAEFIPIAEEMGLISEIGKRVLRKACAECMKWPKHVRVAVNISAVQVKRGNVPAVIREALEGSGLAANRLEIEITESVLLQDTEATHTFIRELHEMGVRLSLDDFGTGYSSLSYLHSYPLDKIKIDRSFLKDIESQDRVRKLVEGVARLSSELGLSVAVEGVETESQCDLLRSIPYVTEMQGFLFSRPVPRLEVRKMLDGTTPIRKVA
ncbi:cyclic di-GMP phosphodiesterase Gmr [Variibacter gotjawalensis]|uniref:Cyclic di-GMP phosphodiesterase Gmr n=1 Tax=Variibacter gotjawalensis TaxID=1333996 RepID=A0A0S3PST4_9BRAD|nr:EAL domain-containing protein [Variibacter gotjawalensis]NIK49287.1 diguanylate cyclase (GGDEF)-like protein [Variibacter gotjawalensis]RZS51138.1 diguanylate cyclase/phosphodiesterase [Variibacter gotjawalensis]BAT58973.1 cyclic di-GMP phosphodiesterase Gmr [Variibacter gotjawalensis]